MKIFNSLFYLIAFSLTLSSFIVQAQQQDQPLDKTYRNHIGIIATPDWNIPASLGAQWSPLVDQSDNSLGFTAGLSFQRDLSKHLSFVTGMLVCKRKLVGSMASSYYDINSGISLPSTNNFSQANYYFEIPLGVKFSMQKKRMSYFIITDVNAEMEFLSKSHGTISFDDTVQYFDEVSGFTLPYIGERFYFSPEIRIGGSYKIGNRLSAGISPGVKYLMGRQSRPIGGSMFSVGLNATMQYDF